METGLNSCSNVTQHPSAPLLPTEVLLCRGSTPAHESSSSRLCAESNQRLLLLQCSWTAQQSNIRGEHCSCLYVTGAVPCLLLLALGQQSAVQSKSNPSGQLMEISYFQCGNKASLAYIHAAGLCPRTWSMIPMLSWSDLESCSQTTQSLHHEQQCETRPT